MFLTRDNFFESNLWILFAGSWSRSGMEKTGSGNRDRNKIRIRNGKIRIRMVKNRDPDGEKSGSGMEKIQIRDKNLRYATLSETSRYNTTIT